MSESVERVSPVTSPVTWALAPILILGPALTCGIPRVMAPLFMICAVAAVITDICKRRMRPDFDKTIAAIFGAFLVYGAISYLWSVNTVDGFTKVGQLAGLFVPLAFLVPVIGRMNAIDLRRLGVLTGIGLGLGAVVFISELFDNFKFYDGLRGGYSEDPIDSKQNKPAVLVSFWLYMLFAYLWPRQNWRTRGFFALAAAAAVFVMYSSQSQSGQLIVLALAPVLAVAITVLPARFSNALTFFVCGFLAVGMPIIAYQYAHKSDWQHNPLLHNSVRARIEIWEQAARRTFERPVLGWGLDSSPYIPSRGEISVLGFHYEVHHLHPHNGLMQIWEESGAIGIAMLCAMFVAFYVRIKRMADSGAQRYAVFMWATTFLYTLSIWGIWQTWFTASLTFMGVMAYAGARYISLNPAQNKTAA